MSYVLIRPAQKEEYLQIAETFISSFNVPISNPAQKEKIAQKIKRIIADEIASFHVADENGKIIGIGAETRFLGASIIGYIGVIPSRRRLGYGSMIFEKVLEEAAKINPTIDLFANPGVDSIYRRFGFIDRFNVHIFELTPHKEKDQMEISIWNEQIPKWVYDLDKKAIGFDRSKIMDFWISLDDTKLVCFEEKGFAFVNENQIGPLIATEKEIVYKIIDNILQSGSKKIIVPEYYIKDIQQYSPKKIQSCLRMSYGDKLKDVLDWIWGYGAFATS